MRLFIAHRFFILLPVTGMVWLCLSCVSTKGQRTVVNPQPVPSVRFVNHEMQKRVDVLVDGSLFTSYCWPDSVFKPILFPVRNAAGVTVTRGYPLQPRSGERSDHRHQVGIWLNYGNVNGYDFWGNGAEGLRNVKLGTIKHRSVESVKEGDGEGVLVTTASWVDALGRELLAERSSYHFISDGTNRIIDRITTLTTTDGRVDFHDTKEGFLGIRVARQLEMPSDEEVTLLDAQGVPTKIKVLPNSGVTGNYRSSEGKTGANVWGTRARWMDLYGSIGEEQLSVVVCDHPLNLNYPTYWHARGYGLFAANPFGVKDFTQGKDSLNYSLAPGQSVTFRYRIIISSGKQLSDDSINRYADAFAKKYD